MFMNYAKERIYVKVERKWTTLLMFNNVTMKNPESWFCVGFFSFLHLFFGRLYTFCPLDLGMVAVEDTSPKFDVKVWNFLLNGNM